MNILYISFDTVSLHKGASVHIWAFCRALAQAKHQVALLTVSATPMPSLTQEIYPSIFHTQLPALGKNLIDRSLNFRRHVHNWLDGKYFDVIHFRSIWEGFWLCRDKDKYCNYLVYEVNGLPSIELKYKYPDVIDDRDFLVKLKYQEDYCLTKADVVITPSTVTADYLSQRGKDASKIVVIANGVDTELFAPDPQALESAPIVNLMYFGTLASWQGIELAIRALAQLPPNFHLQSIGQGNKSQIQALQKLALKLEIADRYQIVQAMPQTELITHLQRSQIVLAPLTLCDRNVVQGCCPLKVLEGMAVGLPVISSDLPILHHLGESRHHFLLVKPNSVESLIDGIYELYNDRQLAKTIGIQARQHVINHFSWQASTQKLLAVYRRFD